MASMYSSYPLYEELVRKVEARKDKGVDINRVCLTITNIERIVDNKELAAEHYEEIIWLITHHHIVTKGVETPIPYDVKIMIGGKGILGCMDNMPPMLQQILAQYIEEETSN